MWQNVLFLACLYFIQGLPYGLQSRFLPVYFRSHGMSLTEISLFKVLLTPWMFKALWAPLVDTYGTKKTWLTWSMVGLIITCFFGAFTPPHLILPLACVLFLFNLLTSTQDIAVDGIAIQVLSTSELAYGNIAQVVGYKFGAVFGGGVLTWLSDYMEWYSLLLSLSSVYVASLVGVTLVVPSVKQFNQHEFGKKLPQESNIRTETESTRDTVNQKQEVDESRYWIVNHFLSIFKSPGTIWMAVFVLIYKLGEQGALNMVPLFLVDKGIQTSSVGFWTGVVGQVMSIGGSILGGWTISFFRLSTLRVLKYVCLLRVIPLLLVFIVINTWHDESQYHFGAAVLCMSLMLLISGTVTTATFTMMMQCSQMAAPSIQATHYTNLATIEVLGKLTFSVLLGSLTDAVGYKVIFVLFILLTVLVIPLLKKCPSEFHKMNKNG